MSLAETSEAAVAAPLRTAVAANEMANAIRALAMDAVQRANSGHPGMPMGMADVATVLFTDFLKFDPGDPRWPDRDRFVLSAGHSSLTLYIQLYLSGYGLELADLEEELIRALGPDVMVSLIESQGHMRRFHSFQNQPAQRHKTIEAQLWRWLGNHKIRYAPLMVGALDLRKVPPPLDGVLSRH